MGITSFRRTPLGLALPIGVLGLGAVLLPSGALGQTTYGAPATTTTIRSDGSTVTTTTQVVTTVSRPAAQVVYEAPRCAPPPPVICEVPRYVAPAPVVCEVPRYVAPVRVVVARPVVCEPVVERRYVPHRVVREVRREVCEPQRVVYEPRRVVRECEPVFESRGHTEVRGFLGRSGLSLGLSFRLD